MPAAALTPVAALVGCFHARPVGLPAGLGSALGVAQPGEPNPQLAGSVEAEGGPSERWHDRSLPPVVRQGEPEP